MGCYSSDYVDLSGTVDIIVVFVGLINFFIGIYNHSNVVFARCDIGRYRECGVLGYIITTEKFTKAYFAQEYDVLWIFLRSELEGNIAIIGG